MKVRSIRAALVGAAIMVMLSPAMASAAAPPPSPWLSAQYDADGSNANTAESTLTPQTIGGAVALRTIAPFANDCDGFRGRLGAPLLSESRVYAVSGTGLAAFDAQTGTALWHTALPPYDHYSLVAVSHGLVIVGGDDCGSVSDPLGDVLAFHSTDGSPAWTLPRPYSDAFIDASVSDKFLVVETGEFPDARELSVYRVQDAHPVWTVAGSYDGPDSHTGEIADASARVVDGRVFVSSINSFGYPVTQARDLATGAVSWTNPAVGLPVRGAESSTVGTADAVVFDGGNNAVDPATGDPRYYLPSATGVRAVDATRVYATCSPDATIVCGYDRTTGVRSWIRGTKASVTRVISAGGVLYLSTGQILNAGNGHLERTLPGVPTAVGQGRVAVLRRSGALTLYGLPGA